MYNNFKGFECNGENGFKCWWYSVFMLCYDNILLMNWCRGCLSIGCMKEYVIECELLINGSVV